MQQYSGRKYLRLAQTAVLLLTLGFVVPSFANVVSGNGAGPLLSSALDLTGFQGYEIQGAMPADISNNVFTQFEVVFKINITDYHDFSAQTVDAGPHGISDTSLFLFDASGNAVYGNDDISFIDTLSFLPTPSGGLGPNAAGVYYLALTFGLDAPKDNMGNALFANGIDSTSVVGPAGVGTFDSWQGGGNAPTAVDSNLYDIQLTGVPEPSSLALLAPGLLLAWTNRKRFFSR